MSGQVLSVQRCSYPGLDERLSILRAGDEVDAVFVRTERFNVLVDTLSTPDLCRQALALMEDDLDRRPLLVVNSHMDWDHYWGNAAIAGRAPIIAHETAHRRFRDPKTQRLLQEKAREEERFQGFAHVGPNLGFSGSFVIDGGDLTLELLHMPGHTPDHLAVWIPEIRTCLAVDAVEDPIPEVWSADPADLRQLRASLRAIRDLNAEFVVLAHGQTCAPSVVDRNIGYFETLAQRVTDTEVSALEDDALAERSGFRLQDFITLPDTMPVATAKFYERCHRSNLRATVCSEKAVLVK